MRVELLTLLAMISAGSLLPAILAAVTPEQDPHAAHPAATPGHDHAGADDHGQVDVHRQGMKHDFSDVAKLAKGFDDPARVAWQKPEHVIELMAITPGMTVADLGAGTGFFEPPLAGAVGAAGKVLALDVEPNMVEHLKKRVAEAGLAQVEPRLAATDDPGLAPSSVDRILIVNTWHHIDDRGPYSAKLRAALRPGGSIWIVDFETTSSKGPPPQHKLEPREVIAELAAGGLIAEQVAEELTDQYIVVARAAAPKP